FAVRSVVIGENWIGAIRRGEAHGHALRRDAPGVVGLMARDAAASVGSQILEESVGQVDRAIRRKRPDLTGGILERREISVVDIRGNLRRHRDRQYRDPDGEARTVEQSWLHERPAFFSTR